MTVTVNAHRGTDLQLTELVQDTKALMVQDTKALMVQDTKALMVQDTKLVWNSP